MTNVTCDTVTDKITITDSQAAELTINIDVTFDGDNVTLNAKSLNKEITFNYITGDCGNDEFDIVFDAIPNNEGDVKLKFTLQTSGWNFNTQAFTFSPINGKNTPNTGTVQQSRQSDTQASIKAFNAQNSTWEEEFTLNLNNGTNSYEIDPKLSGRSG